MKANSLPGADAALFVDGRPALLLRDRQDAVQGAPEPVVLYCGKLVLEQSFFEADDFRAPVQNRSNECAGFRSERSEDPDDERGVAEVEGDAEWLGEVVGVVDERFDQLCVSAYAAHGLQNLVVVPGPVEGAGVALKMVGVHADERRVPLFEHALERGHVRPRALDDAHVQVDVLCDTEALVEEALGNADWDENAHLALGPSRRVSFQHNDVLVALRRRKSSARTPLALRPRGHLFRRIWSCWLHGTCRVWLLILSFV